MRARDQIGFDVFVLDLIEMRRRPARLAILVDHGGAYAFIEIVPGKNVPCGRELALEALDQA